MIKFYTKLAKINALKRKNATSALEANKTLLGLLAKAISEIRMFRQAYVNIVSSSFTTFLVSLLTLLECFKGNS